MPWVTIKTGLTTPDGHEEKLTECHCDYSGCPNVATHMLGVIVALRVSASVCDEHLPKPPAPNGLEFKRYSEYSGGTCDPPVISWSKGIRARGEVRNQYHHSTDIG